MMPFRKKRHSIGGVNPIYSNCTICGNQTAIVEFLDINPFCDEHWWAMCWIDFYSNDWDVEHGELLSSIGKITQIGMGVSGEHRRGYR